GYLTSRPGLYAAPRTIRVGQGYSRDDLVSVLRRAGYVESEASQIWSGSFNKEVGAVEIRPRQMATTDLPRIIRITFDDKRITGVNGDDLTLDGFTLEPETLTNDLSSKTGKRNALSYTAIPAVLVQAILAVEDHRFFDHPGLDLLGIARALWNNASGDRIGQGGSTITQQLVKNTYLSPERSLRRKYAEAMLAFALERRLSKEDIFALYCNEVYLGQRGAVTVRGVEQAALIYFGKELNQLTLSESATIAGMIQGPARYSPERRTAAAQARKNLVLAAMANEGWITSEQFYEAAKEPIAMVGLPDRYRSVAPYFIDYVNRITDSQLDASGATQQIHTTIDLDLQQLAEETLNRQLERLDKVNPNRQTKPQGALVALDPHTGNVLAMVGGRDYGVSQLNRVTDARRQPGSTFKPFVYAAALEDGLSPVRMFADAPRDFTYDRNKVYHPANYGGTYSGREVTMRTGLVQSLNVVTVDVAMQTGLARIANLAAQFGLPKPERYPSLGLGTTEVTPLQLAAAYSAFVNGGRRVEPRVIAAGNNSLESSNLQNEQQLISPTTAYMITNMLSAAIDEGTGRAARDAVKGTAIAGKTGTSRDAWFAGYTPNLVCVVWIGFDDNRQLGLTGGSAALPVWKDFVQAAVALKPELGGRTFECPEGIKFVEIDADSGLLSTLSCPHRKLIAITDRLAPNFECYNHSNLPELFDSEKESDGVLDADVVIARRRESPSDQVHHSGESLRTATRVDVDAQGRKTLVNDMR
ncbi:MAG TPA: PBP1A family penicillin-binding protein, partial [Pyrinomonadaceae bacterium]|nr:PBP1A family penicillin-binding protein [Pyrinomonadaceae bacterium]